MHTTVAETAALHIHTGAQTRGTSPCTVSSYQEAAEHREVPWPCHHTVWGAAAAFNMQGYRALVSTLITPATVWLRSRQDPHSGEDREFPPQNQPVHKPWCMAHQNVCQQGPKPSPRPHFQGWVQARDGRSNASCRDCPTLLCSTAALRPAVLHCIRAGRAVNACKALTIHKRGGEWVMAETTI